MCSALHQQNGDRNSIVNNNSQLPLEHAIENRRYGFYVGARALGAQGLAIVVYGMSLFFEFAVDWVC